MQNPQAIHAYAVASVSGITDLDERDREYLKARADAIGGLTMRDYFAAKALQGWLSNPGPSDETISEVAQWSYRMADAMLNARKIVPQQ